MAEFDSYLGFLTRCLLICEPERRLPQLIRNVRDIYAERHFLKQIACTNFTIGYLAKLILEALKSNQRFRRKESLKVIRAIIKKTPEYRFTINVTHVLFEIYQSFVFDAREEMSWCVSVFIKNQQLSQSDIKWFVDYYQRSEHLVNRLLRYPVSNKYITEWARCAYKTGELRNRTSELLAVGYADNLLDFVNKESPEVIAWAVFYARLPKSRKRYILKRLVTSDSLPTIVEIGLRLGYKDVIKHLYRVATQRKTNIRELSRETAS